MTKALQKCHSTQLSEIAAPVGTPWLWTLAFSQHEDRTPTHGYEATREAAMAAFAKSWYNRPAPPLAWPTARSLLAIGSQGRTIGKTRLGGLP